MEKGRIRMFEPPADDAIRVIWHDGETLRVQYRNGSMYDYSDVSDALAAGLMQSDTRAQFMLQRIRPDRLSIRVEPGTPFPRLAWD